MVKLGLKDITIEERNNSVIREALQGKESSFISNNWTCDHLSLLFMPVASSNQS